MVVVVVGEGEDEGEDGGYAHVHVDATMRCRMEMAGRAASAIGPLKTMPDTSVAPVGSSPRRRLSAASTAWLTMSTMTARIFSETSSLTPGRPDKGLPAIAIPASKKQGRMVYRA